MDERTAMTQFVGGGKGFVCIHISGALDDSWPEYHDVYGRWLDIRTKHAPALRSVRRGPSPTRRRQCAEGITDFVTNDELYTKMGWRSGNHVFMTAELDGVTYPMAWDPPPTARAGSSPPRWATNGLSFETPSVPAPCA